MNLSLKITDSPIPNPNPLFPSDGSFGAISEFWGIVRENENGEKIEFIYYEAYPSMAEKEIRKICESLFSTFPCYFIEVIHRIGKVPVGEPSLWVRTRGKHRKETIQFIDQFIVLLKIDVPIWKTF